MKMDKREWASLKQHVCDVVVVGSGAAGVTLALELAKSRLDVILLEGGGESFSKESQECYGGYSSGRNLTYGLKGSRLRYLGGSTNCWAGGCGELDHEDFVKRDWVKHSGWPLEMRDLQNYYERSSEFLGLSIHRIRDPQAKANLPQFTGFQLRSLEFTRKVRFNSEFSGSLSTNPFVRLFTGANLTGLNRGKESHSVTSAEIRSFDGASSQVIGKYYVLACGGLENPRILLNSGGPAWTPFGNLSDKVGRFFCDHPIAPCATLIGPSGNLQSIEYEARAYIKGDSLQQAAIPFYRIPYVVQQKYGILNTVIQVYLQEEELTAGEISAWRLKNYWNDPNEFSVAGKDLFEIACSPLKILGAMRSRNSRQGERLALRFQTEQAPNPESRVTLVDERDAFGLKRINLAWKFTELERRSLDIAIAYTSRCLQSEGKGTLRIDQSVHNNRAELPFDLRGGQHPSGATRMAASDSEGVVDRDLRVFHTKNLYVCGSSVFPTNGWVNPTFTIIALSMRLADHLVEKSKRPN